jgi:Flp pilus assembly protein TadG
MLAMPFFLLLFSMFEVGLTYTADTLLQNAVNETARMIRTGEVQMDPSMSQQKFRQMVCDRISVLLSCDSHLKIDVREFTSFGGAGFSSPLTPGGAFVDDSNFKFQPGDACSVVLVRAFYAWDPITPGLGAALGNMNNGDHLLTGTAAVRNEPFSTSHPTC